MVFVNLTTRKISIRTKKHLHSVFDFSTFNITRKDQLKLNTDRIFEKIKNKIAVPGDEMYYFYVTLDADHLRLLIEKTVNQLKMHKNNGLFFSFLVDNRTGKIEILKNDDKENSNLLHHWEFHRIDYNRIRNLSTLDAIDSIFHDIEIWSIPDENYCRKPEILPYNQEPYLILQ